MKTNWILLSSVTLMLQSFKSQENVNDLKNSVQASTSFDWLQENLFSQYCLACHNALSPTAGVDFTSYETILNSSRFPRLIVPLNPNDSFVLKVIQTGSMPPNQIKIDAQTTQSLRQWILSGARKNESDPVPQPTPVPTEPPD